MKVRRGDHHRGLVELSDFRGCDAQKSCSCPELEDAQRLWSPSRLSVGFFVLCNRTKKNMSKQAFRRVACSGWQ